MSESYEEYSARMRAVFSPEIVYKATIDKPAAYVYMRP